MTQEEIDDFKLRHEPFSCVIGVLLNEKLLLDRYVSESILYDLCFILYNLHDNLIFLTDKYKFYSDYNETNQTLFIDIKDKLISFGVVAELLSNDKSYELSKVLQKNFPIEAEKSIDRVMQLLVKKKND